MHHRIFPLYIHILPGRKYLHPYGSRIIVYSEWCTLICIVTSQLWVYHSLEVQLCSTLWATLSSLVSTWDHPKWSSGPNTHFSSAESFFSMSELTVFTKAPRMCASVVKSHMTWAQRRPHWLVVGQWHVERECSSHWIASCVRGSHTERGWKLSWFQW